MLTARGNVVMNTKALLAEVELINSEGTKKRPLKHCITDQQMTKLADAMDEDVVPAGQNVIVQGDEGHTFFVIADGDVDVYVDNSKVNTLGRVATSAKSPLLGMTRETPRSLLAVLEPRCWRSIEKTLSHY